MLRSFTKRQRRRNSRAVFCSLVTVCSFTEALASNPPHSMVLVIKYFACQLGVRKSFHFTPEWMLCCKAAARCRAQYVCVCVFVCSNDALLKSIRLQEGCITVCMVYFTSTRGAIGEITVGVACLAVVSVGRDFLWSPCTSQILQNKNLYKAVFYRAHF